MMTIELNRLRNTLRSKQAELDAKVHSGRRLLAIEQSADELDRIQHSQERDLAMVSLDRESKLLFEIRAALHRIALGTFGVCLGCEERIGMKRLEAVPWASSCIGCQEAEDSRLAHNKSGGVVQELSAGADLGAVR